MPDRRPTGTDQLRSAGRSCKGLPTCGMPFSAKASAAMLKLSFLRNYASSVSGSLVSLGSPSESDSEEEKELFGCLDELLSPKKESMLLLRGSEFVDAARGPSRLCSVVKNRFSFRSIQISVATALLRSRGSLSFQLLEPSTTAMPEVNVKSIEEMAMNSRGGNDLFSGMSAGSSTLMVGMSLAS